MSKETSQWLNNYTLIGHTDKRGHAWHYRASDQGAESNHYTGAIPVEDVYRRLFFWEPVSATLRAKAEILTEDGVTVLDIVDNTRQVIIRPDTETVLGVFKEGYQMHPYRETLVELTQKAIGHGVGVGSAGLLAGGAVGWVQFEFEDTQSVGGFQYRPFVTASTSLDGSLATDWREGSQAVVCDNTLSVALSDRTSKRIKKKHTKYSLTEFTQDEIREELGILLVETAENFAFQLERLLNEKVSDAEWKKFQDAHFGVVPKDEGAGRTRALNRNDKLDTLYFSDARVAPWKGTALGVLQAVNTYTHHLITPKAGSRADTNMLRAVRNGAQSVDALDQNTVESLNAVFRASKRKALSFA